MKPKSKIPTIHELVKDASPEDFEELRLRNTEVLGAHRVPPPPARLRRILGSALDQAAISHWSAEVDRLDVWRLVRRLDPSLADVLDTLGFDDETAAAWVYQRHAGLEDSPARLVLQHRSHEVLRWMRRTVDRAIPV